MPGCWSWPPICASSTNRRTSSGLSRWLLEQDLDGQVAAQVGVAALEDGPHAAAGDLAEELVAVAALGGRGHLVGRRLDDGDIRCRRAPCRAGGRGESSRSTGPGSPGHGPAGRLEAEGHVLTRRAVRRRPGLRLQPGAEHAGRAGAVRCIGRKQVTTPVAAANVGHRGGSGKRQSCQGTARIAARICSKGGGPEPGSRGPSGRVFGSG